MASFVNWNGEIVEEKQVSISPNNRSFRYGDGCFETIKVIKGQILLADLHFQRLFSSLHTLKFQFPAFFTGDFIDKSITKLLVQNNLSDFARIRLTVYRGESPLNTIPRDFNFIIQAWPGDISTASFNTSGLHLDIYPDAKKSCDLFSGIKSNNFLPYVMGAIWANEKGLHDAIICNAFDRIAETTIANLFIVENGTIKTPPLSEGCVAGVMRSHLISCFKKEGLPFIEMPLPIDDVQNAAEVFLTNSIYGIRWVNQVGSSSYNNQLSSYLYNKFITPLFATATF